MASAIPGQFSAVGGVFILSLHHVPVEVDIYRLYNSRCYVNYFNINMLLKAAYGTNAKGG